MQLYYLVQQPDDSLSHVPEPLGDIAQNHVISAGFHNVEIIRWGVSYCQCSSYNPKTFRILPPPQSKNDFSFDSSRTERCQKKIQVKKRRIAVIRVWCGSVVLTSFYHFPQIYFIINYKLPYFPAGRLSNGFLLSLFNILKPTVYVNTPASLTFNNCRLCRHYILCFVFI